MKRCLIFDLDNCILDTKSIGTEVLSPVIDVIDLAGKDALITQTLAETLKTELWTYSVEDLAQRHNLPDSITDKIRKQYILLKAPKWTRLYDDYPAIADMQAYKVLVTSGYRNFQKSKVDVTGIEHLFDEIHIDENDNPSTRIGKKHIFEDIIRENGFMPQDVIVIGDNPHSELKAGKELGLITVQTLRPGVEKVEGFDHYVNDFYELNQILKKY